MSVTEALARGIPVVTTDVGGLPEAVGSAPDGTRPGLFFPADDAGALAEHLEQSLATRTYENGSGDRRPGAARPSARGP